MKPFSVDICSQISPCLAYRVFQASVVSRRLRLPHNLTAAAAFHNHEAIPFLWLGVMIWLAVEKCQLNLVRNRPPYKHPNWDACRGIRFFCALRLDFSAVTCKGQIEWCNGNAWVVGCLCLWFFIFSHNILEWISPGLHVIYRPLFFWGLP